MRTRILYVEPDPERRTAMARHLRLAGQWVQEATDGTEAFAHLRDPRLLARRRARPFDVIVADRWSPELGGLALRRVLRALGGACGAIPFVLTTGTVDPDLRGEALALGVRDVLEKPYDGQALFAAIRTAAAPA